MTDKAAPSYPEPSAKGRGPAGDRPESSDRGGRRKAFPRAVQGTFRRIKTAIVLGFALVYFVLPWLRWDRGVGVPDQAVLIDIGNSRMWFFGLEFWAQDVYYLMGEMIFAALALFLATTLAGRVWCGFACPQTGWVDVFVWVERQIQGDRPARMRLDRAPWNREKLLKVGATHGIWLLIAFAYSLTAILYFDDAPTLVSDIVHFQAPQMVLWFLLIFVGMIYGLAGLLREEFCVLICPWSRFQAVLFEEDSYNVVYQDWRGEGRGPWRKSESWEDRAARGGGDCIDCYQCYQVCPTQVDIRKGPQLACIGCGLCIDACNTVMAKIGRPGNLIAFDTESSQHALAQGLPRPKVRLLRTRVLAYLAALALVLGPMVFAVANRPHLTVSVQRDRAPLFVRLSNGGIRNGFTFKIANMTREQRDYTLTLSGIPGATMMVAGADSKPLPEEHLHAVPDSVATFRVIVEAPAAALTGSSTPLTFVLTSARDQETETYGSVFMGP